MRGMMKMIISTRQYSHIIRTFAIGMMLSIKDLTLFNLCGFPDDYLRKNTWFFLWYQWFLFLISSFFLNIFALFAWFFLLFQLSLWQKSLFSKYQSKWLVFDIKWMIKMSTFYTKFPLFMHLFLTAAHVTQTNRMRFEIRNRWTQHTITDITLNRFIEIYYVSVPIYYMTHSLGINSHLVFNRITLSDVHDWTCN